MTEHLLSPTHAARSTSMELFASHVGSLCSPWTQLPEGVPKEANVTPVMT